MIDAYETLSTSSYLRLTTFRKNGTPVSTPVWVAPGPDRTLLIWTVADSPKVTRLRRTPSVLVAQCDRNGTPLGEDVEATAVELPADRLDSVISAINRKYGVLGWVATTGSRLRRGRAGSTGLSITLT